MALLTGFFQSLMGRRPERVGFTLIVGVMLIGQPADLAAAATAATDSSMANNREYQIKAVFLLNFARFVDWPATAFASETAPLELGVLGNDPFGRYLDDAVRGETVNHRPITVRRFDRVEAVTSCHVLFICRSESAHLDQILAQLKGREILTVGDCENFADMGGMIGLVKHNDKVRLQINVDAAKNSQLIISAKLLRPSEIVGTWKKRQLRLDDRSHSPWRGEGGPRAIDPARRYVIAPARVRSTERWRDAALG